jgi:hypothetical protein
MTNNPFKYLYNSCHYICADMVSAHHQIIMTMSCTVEDSHDNGKEMEGSVAYVEMPGIWQW